MNQSKTSKIYKYRCTRCGKPFSINHWVEKNSAVCTPCWEYIKASKSVEEYKRRLLPIKKKKEDHILVENTCWCNPIFREIKGQGYWFHKDEKGETALKVLKTN